MSQANQNDHNKNHKKRRRGRKHNRNNQWNKPTKPWKVNHNNSNSGCCADEHWKKKRKIDIYKSPYTEPYFDSHCHLDWILFKSGYGLRDLSTFANINLLGNFGGAVTVACAPDMIRPVSELINAKRNHNIYGTFGLHPHNAKEWNDNVKQHIIFALKTGQWKINQKDNQKDNRWLCLCGHHNPKRNVFCSECTWEPNKEYLQNMDVLNIVKDLTNECKKDTATTTTAADTKNNKVVGVGECGLDFHYNRSPQDIQKRVFIEQIEISKQLDLPLVIHAREAERDTIEIMKKYCPKHKPIHLHCFTDSLEYGRVMLDSFPNLMIGFTGAITFKKAHHNRNTVRGIPLTRILLETDGPYMAPHPYRGQIAHPGFIPLIAEQIAKLHGVNDVNKVLRQCRLNAKKVYGV
eukprot:1103953_1